MAKKTIVIIAGGTGGHLYPGIATARALVSQSADWNPVFVVRKGDLGKGLLERERFTVVELPGQGFPRKFSPKLFTFPFKVSMGFLKAWQLLKELRPTAVMGMGGYLSFPVLLAARLQGFSTLIHEQNVLPGLSNRVTGRWVKSIALSFAESKRYFTAQKAWVSGLPIRPEIGSLTQTAGRARLGLNPDLMTFLVFGGSQGAHRLNEAVAGACRLMITQGKNFQILHITGERDFPVMQTVYQSIRVSSNVMAYCHDMAAALAAADFVLCRSGASTIAELVVAQKPALLVPFPFASENHQFFNAQVLVEKQAAVLLSDAELNAERLAELFQRCLKNPEFLKDQSARLSELCSQTPHREAAKRLAEYLSHMP